MEIVSRLFGHIGIPLSMYASKRASGDLIRIDEVEDAVQPYGAVRKIVRPGTVLRMRAEGRAARMERGSIGQGVIGIGRDRVEPGFGAGQTTIRTSAPSAVRNFTKSTHRLAGSM